VKETRFDFSSNENLFLCFCHHDRDGWILAEQDEFKGHRLLGADG